MTIRDVAEYCGVSVSTVSRVLNGRPDVSDNVRQKILNAIEKLNYIPNSSARALGRTSAAPDSIGVIVRGGGNPFFTLLIQSIENTAKSLGYTIVVRHIPSTANELNQGAALVRSRRLPGLIFLGGCFDYDKQRVASLDVPFVCCTFSNSFGSLEEHAFSSVSIDDRAEAKRAVEYLISNGHRKIAILLDKRDDSSIGQLRYMGYCDALREAGIEPDPSLICETGAYDMQAAYNRTLKLIDSNAEFTAIFAIADTLAIATMKALHDRNISIPEDVSIIAIDGLEMSMYSVPTLTTLVQPRLIIGAESVKTLVNVMNGEGEHQHIRLAAQMRYGASVADIHSRS